MSMHIDDVAPEHTAQDVPHDPWVFGMGYPSPNLYYVEVRWENNPPPTRAVLALGGNAKTTRF